MIDAAGPGPVEEAPRKRRASESSALATVPVWGWVVGGAVAVWALYRVLR